MSTKTLQENYSSRDDRKVAISNQEITTRKWKFDSIFKFISGIIYGFFFGMLPATFIFNSSIDASDPDKFEISMIISLLVIGILSITLIFWAFKGDIKKKHPIAYWITHLLNSIALSAGVLVATLLQPDTIDKLGNISEDRFLIFGASYAGYALFMIIVSFITLFMYRRQFPLSWSRYSFVAFSLLFAGIGTFLIYLAVPAQNASSASDNSVTLFLVLAFVSLIISVLILGLGLAFIKRFRDVLLGERTEYEIDTIRDWESSRVLSIIMTAAMIATFTGAIILQATSNMFDSNDLIPLYIEAGIDALFVLPYIIIVSIIKVKSIKNAHKNTIASKIFKTIDNGLMLDVFAWIIAIKSIILQGVIVSLGDTNTMWNATNEFKSLLLIIGFGSLILLYGFTTIIQLNVPNLRNTAITIPTIAFAIITALFVVLFSGFLYKPGQSDKSSISNWVFVFMPLVITIGISISLIIKICIVAKIFKTEWKEPVVIDNSDIAKEQAQETNDFIGERTEAFDLDQIEKNKESIKSGKDNESVKELRDAIKESQKEV